MPELKIWCNADLNGEALIELQSGLRDHHLLLADDQTSNLVSSGPNSQLEDADVAFGQPDVQQLILLQGLRWTHLTSAGYTRYDTPAVRTALTSRGASLTNSSGVFDEPCAQHLLACMLASARKLPECVVAQSQSQSWAYDSLRGETRILQDETVLILGYGAIARRLIELLAPFRLMVSAVRQTVRGDEPIPVYPASELRRLLCGADHVINVLPAATSTAKIMGPEEFRMVKPGARFYNVGRGTTVDQEALIEALTTRRLAGAYLDVTDPEPLPRQHPLWTTPNCFVTPHIAGGHQHEMLRLVRHFLQNLKRYVAGDALIDRVM